MPIERPEAHDILLIPPLKPKDAESTDDGRPTGMLRMAIQENGHYTASEVLDAKDEGGRKVYSIARPAPQYGPGFAILPIRPDPGSQSDTCFLINTENLLLPNPWTAADWDAFDAAARKSPAPAEAQQAANPEWKALEDDFRMLVAGPKGKVYLVDFAAKTVAEVPGLNTQVSIWNQLREGLIVGSTLYQDKVVPLVNVTSIKITRDGGGQ
jgi:hypothetical protein